MAPVRIDRQGILFVRLLRMLEKYSDPHERAEAAAREHGELSPVTTHLKAAIGAIQTDFGGPAQEFMPDIRALTALDRLPGRHEVASAGNTLQPMRVSVPIVLTRESMDLDGPAYEAGAIAQITQAIATGADAAFLDPSNAGSSLKPRSVLYDATRIVSSGSPVADPQLLLEAFAGDPATTAFIGNALVAQALARARATSGSALYPDLTAKGGSLLGLPFLISAGSPAGQLALVDGAAVVVSFEGVEIAIAQAGRMVQSMTSPSGFAARISRFQEHLIVLRAALRTNWQLARDGAAVCVSDICGYIDTRL